MISKTLSRRLERLQSVEHAFNQNLCSTFSMSIPMVLRSTNTRWFRGPGARKSADGAIRGCQRRVGVVADNGN